MSDTPEPTNPTVDSDSRGRVIGPRERVIRTIYQVLLATFASFPAAFTALATAGVDIPTNVVAVSIGFTAAFTIIATAAMNAWNARD